MEHRFRTNKNAGSEPEKSRAFRTELSINDIRASAWNAVQGNMESYKYLREQNKKLAKIANSRLRALEKAGLDMFAYDRAITFLENQGRKSFSTNLPLNYTVMVTQLSELVTFINVKTSTISGARKALHDKIQSISDATGHKYTEQQAYNLGRLLGTDSISTLLRDVRGGSEEVLEVLEELALSDINENRDRINSVVNKYLQGYNPFELDWSIKSRSMNYDEMMDALRDISSGEWEDMEDW